MEIHKNLEGEYVKNLYYLMKRPVGRRSVEFNDNRIALFVAQRGNCAVMGTPLDVKKTDCHHIIRSKDGGDDSYQNLVVVSSAIHELIHATSTIIIQKYLEIFTPNKKQLAKINKYRKILNLELLA